MTSGHSPTASADVATRPYRDSPTSQRQGPVANWKIHRAIVMIEQGNGHAEIRVPIAVPMLVGVRSLDVVTRADERSHNQPVRSHCVDGKGWSAERRLRSCTNERRVSLGWFDAGLVSVRWRNV